MTCDFADNDWLLCLAKLNGDIIFMPAESPNEAYEMAARIDESGPMQCDCHEAVVLRKPEGFHGEVLIDGLGKRGAYKKRNRAGRPN